MQDMKDPRILTLSKPIGESHSQQTRCPRFRRHRFSNAILLTPLVMEIIAEKRAIACGFSGATLKALRIGECSSSLVALWEPDQNRS